jgi:hypothetical protein
LATPEEETCLVRKIDLRILPITCLLYLFACKRDSSLRAFYPLLIILRIYIDLDRSNFGNARLQGLPQETLSGDPTGTLFSWVNSAFYVSYVSPILHTFFLVQISAPPQTVINCERSLPQHLYNQILFQIPGTVCSKLFPPSYWMAATAIGWGICSTLTVSLQFTRFLVTQTPHKSQPVGICFRFRRTYLRPAGSRSF